MRGEVTHTRRPWHLPPGCGPKLGDRAEDFGAGVRKAGAMILNNQDPPRVFRGAQKQRRAVPEKAMRVSCKERGGAKRAQCTRIPARTRNPNLCIAASSELTKAAAK
eukprot:3941973-Rhodomonas_salina.2